MLVKEILCHGLPDSGRHGDGGSSHGLKHTMQLTASYECKTYDNASDGVCIRSLIPRVCYSFSFCCCVSIHVMREWPQFYQEHRYYQYFVPSRYLCRSVRRSDIAEICDMTWIFPLCICDTTSHIPKYPIPTPISDGQTRETRRILPKGFRKHDYPRRQGLLLVEPSLFRIRW